MFTVGFSRATRKTWNKIEATRFYPWAYETFWNHSTYKYITSYIHVHTITKSEIFNVIGFLSISVRAEHSFNFSVRQTSVKSMFMLMLKTTLPAQAQALTNLSFNHRLMTKNKLQLKFKVNIKLKLEIVLMFLLLPLLMLILMQILVFMLILMISLRLIFTLLLMADLGWARTSSKA